MRVKGDPEHIAIDPLEPRKQPVKLLEMAAYRGNQERSHDGESPAAIRAIASRVRSMCPFVTGWQNACET
jgi:hypothetical protein